MADVCPNLPDGRDRLDETSLVCCTASGVRPSPRLRHLCASERVMPSQPAIDTSRHSCECLCTHCERNGSGQFALRAASELTPTTIASEETIEIQGYRVNLAVGSDAIWRIWFHGVASGLYSLTGQSTSPDVAKSDARRTLARFVAALPLDLPTPFRGAA